MHSPDVASAVCDRPKTRFRATARIAARRPGGLVSGRSPALPGGRPVSDRDDDSGRGRRASGGRGRGRSGRAGTGPLRGRRVVRVLEEALRHCRDAAEKPGADAVVVFLIGSPATNPAVAKALGPGGWPEVSDQGIVLKRAVVDGKPALVVGGGSPKATLWAVYELVSRWGVRYLLHGDVLPESPGTLRLPEEDVVLEPKLRVRQWRVINDFACGPESWGMADYRPVLDQLAKLKFNRVFLSVWTYQPFLHFEHKGVKRQSAWLWFKYRYPITDDMIGRQLFDNRPEFWNPDLPHGAGYEELAAAGERLVHELMAHAHGRGMQCVMTANPLEYPTEFAPLLADSQPIRQLGGETIVPGPKLPPDDPGLTELATAVLRATVNTYPEVDYLLLCMPEHRQWESLDEQAWKALDAKYDLSRITSLDEMLAAAAQRPDVPGGAERAVREVKGDLVMLRFYDRLLSECQCPGGHEAAGHEVHLLRRRRGTVPRLAADPPAGLGDAQFPRVHAGPRGEAPRGHRSAGHPDRARDAHLHAARRQHRAVAGPDDRFAPRVDQGPSPPRLGRLFDAVLADRRPRSVRGVPGPSGVGRGGHARGRLSRPGPRRLRRSGGAGHAGHVRGGRKDLDLAGVGRSWAGFSRAGHDDEARSAGPDARVLRRGPPRLPAMRWRPRVARGRRRPTAGPATSTTGSAGWSSASAISTRSTPCAAGRRPRRPANVPRRSSVPTRPWPTRVPRWNPTPASLATAPTTAGSP